MRKSITLLLLAMGMMWGAGLKGQIFITEVMYHSPASPDTLEFIEIQNRSSFPEAMTGYTFTGGVNFTFPAMLLPPGEFAIVAIDSAAFQNVFGPLPYVFQWTSDSLKNTGELVELRNSGGSVVVSFNYDDVSPWPALAAGEGRSMNFCNWAFDFSLGAAWEDAGTPTGLTIGGRSIFANPGACCYSTDATPPTILHHSYNAGSIGIKFSEPIDAPFASTTYFTGLSVSNVSYVGIGDSVTITLTSAFPEGTLDTLHIEGVEDMACNALAPVDLVFALNTLTTPLAISEILIAGPLSPNPDSLQFIEIGNPLVTPRPLGGLELWNNGVLMYTFPPQSLTTNQFVTVAQHPEFIERFFGILDIRRWTGIGTLNDVSANLKIINTNGVVVDSVTYFSGTNGWPSTVNTGMSALMCQIDQDNTIGTNWTTGTQVGDSAGIFIGNLGPIEILASPGRMNCRTVGLESRYELEAKVFPNPTTGMVQIVCDNALVTSVILTDNTGRQIREIKRNGSNWDNFDISEHGSGLYFLCFRSEYGAYLGAEKVIVR